MTCRGGRLCPPSFGGDTEVTPYSTCRVGEVKRNPPTLGEDVKCWVSLRFTRRGRLGYREEQLALVGGRCKMSPESEQKQPKGVIGFKGL